MLSFTEYNDGSTECPLRVFGTRECSLSVLVPSSVSAAFCLVILLAVPERSGLPTPTLRKLNLTQARVAHACRNHRHTQTATRAMRETSSSPGQRSADSSAASQRQRRSRSTELGCWLRLTVNQHSHVSICANANVRGCQRNARQLKLRPISSRRRCLKAGQLLRRVRVCFQLRGSGRPARTIIVMLGLERMACMQTVTRMQT
eukprot:2345193-Rhodomonas_salina.6